MKVSDRRIIVLTGAPLASSLKWDDRFLSAPLQEAFLTKPPPRPTSRLPSSEGPRPTWRSLPLEREHLPTGFTQLSHIDHDYSPAAKPRDDVAPESSFLTATDLSFHSAGSGEAPRQSSLSPPNDDEDLLTQFYEHSYAVHEDLSSSFDPGSMPPTFCSPCSLDSSISDAVNPSSPPSPTAQQARTRLLASPITNLNRIPPATYLHSITPQTMTVTLIVGIIALPPPRLVTTRHASPLALVEMLVGDETKAGFGITLWLPPPPSSPSDAPPSHRQPPYRNEQLRSATARLRPRDVVLARNVALSAFRGKVYGQSLRGEATTLDLLYRDVVDASDRGGAFREWELEGGEEEGGGRGGDEGGAAQAMEKIQTVRRWVREFVARGTTPKGDDGASAGVGRATTAVALPEDTQ